MSYCIGLDTMFQLFEKRQICMPTLKYKKNFVFTGTKGGKCKIISHFFPTFLCVYFWRARVCWPLLCKCRPFMIFEGCLNSNSECCRSKRARYQLSHHPARWKIDMDIVHKNWKNCVQNLRDRPTILFYSLLHTVDQFRKLTEEVSAWQW